MRALIVASGLLLCALSPARAGIRGTGCARLVTDPESAEDCTAAQFAAQVRALGVAPGTLSQFGTQTPAPVLHRVIVPAYRGIAVADDSRCRDILKYDIPGCERLKCQLPHLDEIKSRNPEPLSALAEMLGARFMKRPDHSTEDDRCVAEQILALPGVGDYEVASAAVDSNGRMPVFKASELVVSPGTNDFYRKSDDSKPVVLGCKLGLLGETLLAEKMGYRVVTSWPLTLGTLNCQVPWLGRFNY